MHGVTSSGKTELYIHLINKALAEGKQVLYLVPEIALTTQLTTRLKRVFGRRLGVYHSKFSDAERVEIWNNVLNDKSYDVIIGFGRPFFCLSDSWDWSLWMKSTNRVTSNTIPHPAIMPVMQPLCWLPCTVQKHCWELLRQRLRLISMLKTENSDWWS